MFAHSENMPEHLDPETTEPDQPAEWEPWDPYDLWIQDAQRDADFDDEERRP